MANDCYPDYDDYDDVEDGRQQLAEYDLFVYEQSCKARALLALPTAHDLARKVAEDLAVLVRQHATTDGDTTLAYMLCDTVAELVLKEALQSHAGMLEQAVTREGFIAITKVRDVACEEFEDLLQSKQGGLHADASS